MTGGLWGWSPVVSYHPKTGLVIPVADIDELGVLIAIVVLRVHMVTAIADWTVFVAVNKEGV